MSIVSTE